MGITQPHVLVVEDSKITILMVINILTRNLNCLLDIAETGEKARDFLNKYVS